jgi:hypothetical protein
VILSGALLYFSHIVLVFVNYECCMYILPVHVSELKSFLLHGCTKSVLRCASRWSHSHLEGSTSCAVESTHVYSSPAPEEK